MGCYCCTGILAKESIKSKLRLHIQSGNLTGLKDCIELIKDTNQDFDLNHMRFKIDHDLVVTALGLSLLAGHENIFTYILNELSGDFIQMERLFEKAETTGLSIICLSNHTRLLKIYLPIYFQLIKNEKTPVNPDATLSLDSKQIHTDHNYYTPIQIACESGHVEVIRFLFEYSKHSYLVPAEIDVHYIDTTTGYNCALLACKKNNFRMIEYLFENCRADFFIQNNFNENAINVLAIGSKENPSETFECLKYLIETIGINFEYNYQESLFMLEEGKALDYFESKLEQVGIKCKKHEIVRKKEEDKKTIRVDLDTGEKFSFLKLFPELLATDMQLENKIIQEDDTELDTLSIDFQETQKF